MVIMPKHAKKSRSEEQNLQRKYVQLQIIRQQLAALMEEKKAITEKANEFSMTVSALQKLQDVKNREEMWSSLGSGTFVRSDIKDTEKVFIAVGAGVVLRKTADESIKILSSRLDDLHKFEAELMAEIMKYSQTAEHLEKELEHAARNR